MKPRTFTLLMVLFIVFMHSVNVQGSTVYAYNDFINTFENSEIKAHVLNNDIGLSDGVKSLTITIQPEYGQAVVQEDNTILYIPNESYTGEDYFEYSVCNGYGNCGTASVKVVVEDIDFTPVVINDSAIYNHGSSLQFDFLANDVIGGDRPIVITFLNDLQQGDYVLTDENLLDVKFERKFIGVDSLIYSVCDTDNDCDEGIIYFNVSHGGDTEFFIPDGFSPNRDNINETFEVPDFYSYYSNDYSDISVVIVDSWGRVVYQNEKYKNDWDGVANQGASKGKVVPAGTYYYIFRIEGHEKPLTGYVYVAN